MDVIKTKRGTSLVHPVHCALQGCVRQQGGRPRSRRRAAPPEGAVGAALGGGARGGSSPAEARSGRAERASRATSSVSVAPRLGAPRHGSLLSRRAAPNRDSVIVTAPRREATRRAPPPAGPDRTAECRECRVECACECLLVLAGAPQGLLVEPAEHARRGQLGSPPRTRTRTLLHAPPVMRGETVIGSRGPRSAARPNQTRHDQSADTPCPLGGFGAAPRFGRFGRFGTAVAPASARIPNSNNNTVALRGLAALPALPALARDGPRSAPFPLSCIVLSAPK